MTLKVGNDMKLYYNTGTNASPVWDEVAIVGDVTVPFEVEQAEVDLRVSNYLLNLPSKISAGFDFLLANDPGGTDFDALRTRALARTPTQFASANGAIATSGTEYFKAFGTIGGFAWAQPTRQLSSHDVSVALAYHEESSALVEPAWVVVP